MKTKQFKCSECGHDTFIETVRETVELKYTTITIDDSGDPVTENPIDELMIDSDYLSYRCACCGEEWDDLEEIIDSGATE